MPRRRSKTTDLARLLRSPQQDEERLKLIAEFTEPYGTIAAGDRILRGEGDAFDYLAALPVLGLPARALKGIKRASDITPDELAAAEKAVEDLARQESEALKARSEGNRERGERAMAEWNAMPVEERVELARRGELNRLPPDDAKAINRLVQQNRYPRDTAARIYYGILPMDNPSRMARAREQGFNVDEVVYRGSPDEIRQNRGNTFSTSSPGVAGTYVPAEDGGAVYPMFRRPGKEAVYDESVLADSALLMDEYTPAHWSHLRYEHYPEAMKADMLRRQNEMAERGGYGVMTREQMDALENARGRSTDDFMRDAQKAGYDSARLNDIVDTGYDEYGQLYEEMFGENPISFRVNEAGDTVRVHDMDLPAPDLDNEAAMGAADIFINKPEDLRSINAAFDPDTSSPRSIMAGLGGAGLTALIANLLRQQEEEERALRQ